MQNLAGTRSQLIISAGTPADGVASAATSGSCVSCAFHGLASEGIYLTVLLAFDVSFMLMNLNSLDVPLSIPIFTFLSVRSKSGP